METVTTFPKISQVNFWTELNNNKHVRIEHYWTIRTSLRESDADLTCRSEIRLSWFRSNVIIPSPFGLQQISRNDKPSWSSIFVYEIGFTRSLTRLYKQDWVQAGLNICGEFVMRVWLSVRVDEAASTKMFDWCWFWVDDRVSELGQVTRSTEITAGRENSEENPRNKEIKEQKQNQGDHRRRRKPNEI
jgi:hypothetical protein